MLEDLRAVGFTHIRLTEREFDVIEMKALLQTVAEMHATCLHFEHSAQRRLDEFPEFHQLLDIGYVKKTNPAINFELKVSLFRGAENTVIRLFHLVGN